MSTLDCLKDICHSTILDKPDVPKFRTSFYSEVHLAYQKLHKNKQITTKETALEYKNILTTYLDTLNQYYYIQGSQKEHAEFAEYLKIWDLILLLHFNTHDDNLSKALMDWYAQYNKSKLFEFSMQDICSNDPLRHPSFWPYALRLTTFGRLDRLSQLLQAALPFSQKQFFSQFLDEFQNVISEKPYDTKHLNQMLTTLQRPDFKHPAVYYHAIELSKIVYILLGDRDAITENALGQSHAFILYHYYQPKPVLDSNNIFEKATQFFEQNSDADVYGSLLKGDMYRLFSLCADMDWWLLAHLVDLLIIEEKLDNQLSITMNNISMTLPTREYFIVYYASNLKNKFGLWHMAFEYMATCDEIGKDVIIEHSSTMNLDDQEFEQAIEYCKDHDLTEVACSLYETKANECLISKDYNRAIQLYQKAGLYEQIECVYDVMITNYAVTGEIYDITATKQSSGLCYTIYHYLWEMVTGHTNGDHLMAASAFMELISNTEIPNLFIIIILWEGSKLIGDKPWEYFTKSDIIKVQNLWKKLNQERSLGDFKLFHFLIFKDKSKAMTADTLNTAMMVFLDTTAVSFARALDATSK